MYCKTKLVSLWMLLSRITGKLRIWKMMLFEESWKLYSPYDLSVMIFSSTAWFLCSKTTCMLQKICYQLPHCCALLPFEFKSAKKSICFVTHNIFTPNHMAWNVKPLSMYLKLLSLYYTQEKKPQSRLPNIVKTKNKLRNQSWCTCWCITGVTLGGEFYPNYTIPAPLIIYSLAKHIDLNITSTLQCTKHNVHAVLYQYWPQRKLTFKILTTTFSISSFETFSASKTSLYFPLPSLRTSS